MSGSTVATKIRNKLLGINGETPTSGSALSGFTIARNGPVLHIKKNDNSDFSVKIPGDGIYCDAGMYADLTNCDFLVVTGAFT